MRKKTTRLCMSGAFCTGKSWTAKAVAEALAAKGKTVKVVVEGARIAKNLGFPINQDATVESEIRILLFQIENEMVQEGLYDYVISDRGLFDSLPYIEDNLHNCKYEKWGCDFHLLNWFTQYIRLHMKYDHVFHMPPNLPIVNDGLRATDRSYQLRLNDLLKMKYLELGVDPTPVSSTDLEENVRFIIGTLGLSTDDVQISNETKHNLATLRAKFQAKEEEKVALQSAG